MLTLTLAVSTYDYVLVLPEDVIFMNRTLFTFKASMYVRLLLPLVSNPSPEPRATTSSQCNSQLDPPVMGNMRVNAVGRRGLGTGFRLGSGIPS